MLDNLLIKYASPTLGGIKSGSLFKIYKDDKFDLKKEIENYNLLYNPLDLYLEIIYSCYKYDLIYVYRLKMLVDDFSDNDIKYFLKSLGYDCVTMEDYIFHLKKRFELLGKTPHEIGIFLGYPLYDVKSFIKYKGKNFKLSGYWKVYNDVENCSKKFKDFKKYRDEFTYLYKNNYSLKSLVNKKS